MNLCNETVTVINQRYNQRESFTEYKKTIIQGTSWYGSLKSNVDSSGLKAANQYIVRIPADASFEGKSYVNPIVYWKLTDEEVKGAFTFANGDLIVHGSVSEPDEEITPKLLHDNYAEVLTVLTVNDNRRTNNAPHWKVVGA